MEKILKIVNVEGIIQKDDKYLFVKRSEKEAHAGGTLSLVGGKVEDTGNVSNTLEKTLAREIKEEVDIEIENNIKYVTSSHFTTDDGDSVVDIVFLCRHKSGEARVMDTDELTEVVWLTKGQAMNEESIMSWTKDYLELSFEKD